MNLCEYIAFISVELRVDTRCLIHKNIRSFYRLAAMPNIFLENEHCEAREIASLEPVLQNWIKANREYINVCGYDDPPWNYGERSCVSLLAAGCWLAGGIALQDWRAEKGHEDQRWGGWCDLWVRMPDECQSYVEAKLELLPAGYEREHVRSSIEWHLSRATTDASKHTGASPEEQLGVLFVAPFYPKSQQDNLSERVANWLESVYSVPHSVIAWIFRDTRDFRPTDNVVSPGLVLIARTSSCQGQSTHPSDLDLSQ
jgi:hypothetical protein